MVLNDEKEDAVLGYHFISFTWWQDQWQPLCLLVLGTAYVKSNYCGSFCFAPTSAQFLQWIGLVPFTFKHPNIWQCKMHEMQVLINYETNSCMTFCTIRERFVRVYNGFIEIAMLHWIWLGRLFSIKKTCNKQMVDVGQWRMENRGYINGASEATNEEGTTQVKDFSKLRTISSRSNEEGNGRGRWGDHQFVDVFLRVIRNAKEFVGSKLLRIVGKTAIVDVFQVTYTLNEINSIVCDSINETISLPSELIR